MPDVLPPVKRHRGRPRGLLFPVQIVFRTTEADVALLAAYATATQQKPGTVMRDLMRVLREQYGQLEQTNPAGEP